MKNIPKRRPTGQERAPVRLWSVSAALDHARDARSRRVSENAIAHDSSGDCQQAIDDWVESANVSVVDNRIVERMVIMNVGDQEIVDMKTVASVSVIDE